eukprot:4435568-Pleurochrysis_carterae.AAC.2
MQHEQFSAQQQQQQLLLQQQQSQQQLRLTGEQQQLNPGAQQHQAHSHAHRMLSDGSVVPHTRARAAAMPSTPHMHNHGAGAAMQNLADPRDLDYNQSAGGFRTHNACSVNNAAIGNSAANANANAAAAAAAVSATEEEALEQLLQSEADFSTVETESIACAMLPEIAEAQAEESSAAAPHLATYLSEPGVSQVPSLGHGRSIAPQSATSSAPTGSVIGSDGLVATSQQQTGLASWSTAGLASSVGGAPAVMYDAGLDLSSIGELGSTEAALLQARAAQTP